MFFGKGGSLYKIESAAFLEKLYNFDGTDRLHNWVEIPLQTGESPRRQVFNCLASSIRVIPAKTISTASTGKR